MPKEERLVQTPTREDSPVFDISVFKKYFDRTFACTKQRLLPLTDQKIILAVIVRCTQLTKDTKQITARRFLDDCGVTGLPFDDAVLRDIFTKSIPEDFRQNLRGHIIDSAPGLLPDEKEHLKALVEYAESVAEKREKKKAPVKKNETQPSPFVEWLATLGDDPKPGLARLIAEYGGGKNLIRYLKSKGLTVGYPAFSSYVTTHSMGVEHFIEKFGTEADQKLYRERNPNGSSR